MILSRTSKANTALKFAMSNRKLKEMQAKNLISTQKKHKNKSNKKNEININNKTQRTEETKRVSNNINNVMDTFNDLKIRKAHFNQCCETLDKEQYNEALISIFPQHNNKYDVLCSTFNDETIHKIKTKNEPNKSESVTVKKRRNKRMKSSCYNTKEKISITWYTLLLNILNVISACIKSKRDKTNTSASLLNTHDNKNNDNKITIHYFFELIIKIYYYIQALIKIDLNQLAQNILCILINLLISGITYEYKLRKLITTANNIFLIISIAIIFLDNIDLDLKQKIKIKKHNTIKNEQLILEMNRSSGTGLADTATLLSKANQVMLNTNIQYIEDNLEDNIWPLLNVHSQQINMTTQKDSHKKTYAKAMTELVPQNNLNNKEGKGRQSYPAKNTLTTSATRKSSTATNITTRYGALELTVENKNANQNQKAQQTNENKYKGKPNKADLLITNNNQIKEIAKYQKIIEQLEKDNKTQNDQNKILSEEMTKLKQQNKIINAHQTNLTPVQNTHFPSFVSSPYNTNHEIVQRNFYENLKTVGPVTKFGPFFTSTQGIIPDTQINNGDGIDDIMFVQTGSKKKYNDAELFHEEDEFSHDEKRTKQTRSESNQHECDDNKQDDSISSYNTTTTNMNVTKGLEEVISDIGDDINKEKSADSITNGLIGGMGLANKLKKIVSSHNDMIAEKTKEAAAKAAALESDEYLRKISVQIQQINENKQASMTSCEQASKQQTSNITPLSSSSNKDLHEISNFQSKDDDLNVTLLPVEVKAIEESRRHDNRITFSGKGLRMYYGNSSETRKEFLKYVGGALKGELKKCKVIRDSSGVEYLLVIPKLITDVNTIKRFQFKKEAFGEGLKRIKNKESFKVCFDLNLAIELDDDIKNKLNQLGLRNAQRHKTFKGVTTALVKAEVNGLRLFLKLFKTGIDINDKHLDIYPWLYQPIQCNMCAKYGHNDNEKPCKSDTLHCLKCAEPHGTRDCSSKINKFKCLYCMILAPNQCDHAAFSADRCTKYKIEIVKLNRYVISLLINAELINHEFEAIRQHRIAAEYIRFNELPSLNDDRLADNENEEEASGNNKITVSDFEFLVRKRIDELVAPLVISESEKLRTEINNKTEKLEKQINSQKTLLIKVRDATNAHATVLHKLSSDQVIAGLESLPIIVEMLKGKSTEGK